MSETTGTFLVTHAETDSAVLRDVDTGQLHPLELGGDLTEGEVLRATIAPEPPLEVVWSLREVEERWVVDLVDSDLAPTTHSKELVEGIDVGEFQREERAGRGEIHVFRVPDDQLEAAAADVLADEATLARAARLEAVRVEVRTADPGILSVRYLPD